MTTKILIANFGPDHLLVRTYAKDNEPGDALVRFSSAEFVHPQQAKEFWVHSMQGLVLDEDKVGMFAPPETKAP